MQKIESSTQLEQWQARRGRKTVALVATMGNLHDGHMALLRRARTLAELSVVSLYVNPTQFGPQEDFDRYPRTPEADCRKLSAGGADMVFLPSREMIYPFPEADSITFRLPPSYAHILCGAQRPGHFEGVVAVVSRLFHLLCPQVAVFGAKDYQQQWIIRKMVRDLHFPLTIETLDTVREQDGLALSSRNQYLSTDERRRAPALYRALTIAAAEIRAGAPIERALAAAKKGLAEQATVVEYLQCRDTRTLQAATDRDRDFVLLVAAKFGATRLIDNLVVTLPPQ